MQSKPMFQSFDSISDPAQAGPRLQRLRAAMAHLQLDGMLVPRSDEHQGEYVPACAERLKWLTGFTGSAGVVLVLKEQAVLFVDGRYTLQARHQVDPEVFAIENLIGNPPPEWLMENVPAGTRIGLDPWLHTISEVAALRKAG